MTVIATTPTLVLVDSATGQESKPAFAKCVLCDGDIARPKEGWLPSMILIHRRLRRDPRSTELVKFVFCGTCGRELRKQGHNTFSFSKVQHVLREEERARDSKRNVLTAKFSELFLAREGKGNGRTK